MANIITYNEALDAEYALFNEVGRVLDFSEATMVVAKNGTALHNFVNSFDREDPEEDMTQDEYDFYRIAKEVSTRTQTPVGFFFGYRIGAYREEFLRMPDLVAGSIWKNRMNLLD